MALKRCKPQINRRNFAMDDDTHARARQLAEAEKRSVSNLLVVLVDREWYRLHPDQKPKSMAA